MKIDKRYQLAAIQHTMRCLRGCIDTVWAALSVGEDFVGKMDHTTAIVNLCESIKGLEQRAFDEIERLG